MAKNIHYDLLDANDPRFVKCSFTGIKGLEIIAIMLLGALDNPQRIEANGKEIKANVHFDNFADFEKWIGKNIDNVCSQIGFKL